MKKLLLTSAGFLNPKIAEEFLKLTNDKEAKILMVAYAQDDNEQFYVNESKKELEELGFGDIFVLNMDEFSDISSLKDFDVIYVCGGNTYSILKKMKEFGLDKFIINQVNKGSIYVGVSAGSIIAGQTIEIAGWGSEGDSNDVDLKDLSGLGFTDIAIFPHFKESISDELVKFREKVKYPVQELSDSQALLIVGDKVDFLG